MLIGYVRVRTTDQTTQRQLVDIKLDKVFEDKLSGKDRNRPQLQVCIEFVREGDTLIVHSMDRLARDLADLLALVKELTAKKVAVQFVKENLTFNGNDTSISKLLLCMLGAVAEFERNMIKQRQREGIAALTPEQRARKYPGRKQKLTPAKVEVLRARAATGSASLAALATEYGVSRGTLYAYLRAAQNVELSDRLAG